VDAFWGADSRHGPAGMSTDLAATARELRYRIIQMSHAAEAPHLASALSCVDLLTAYFFGKNSPDPAKAKDPGRDRFILSKGHAAIGLYATLAKRGYFPSEWLERFAQEGAELAEQPSPGCAPGVELATGSLGHGLPVGVGLALGARLQKKSAKVVVLMSDGECQEGSVWEAAMFAPAQRLSHLTVWVDYNKWQATGRSPEVMAMDPFVDKWKAFGWRAREIDGHDIQAVAQAMSESPDPEGRPTAWVAHTVKGKGVSFMENDNNWHYRIPTAEEVAKAGNELGQA
jgi:transketolase